MPRFYFDTYDGTHLVVDHLGLDLEGIEAAKHAAVTVLPEMARDALPDGDRMEFSVRVRDENGRRVLMATLSFSVERAV
jgi:hypothetical protein